MRWRTRHQKYTDLYSVPAWRRKIAWYPVYCEDIKRYVWLEKVYQRNRYLSMLLYFYVETSYYKELKCDGLTQ
jgi:hypothetical protein